MASVFNASVAMPAVVQASLAKERHENAFAGLRVQIRKNSERATLAQYSQ